ncbi:MAG: DUF6247 family protein [Actinomycetota bacterium]|nr:DUF6247 family protein [Actinomycetota bacterium]
MTLEDVRALLRPLRQRLAPCGRGHRRLWSSEPQPQGRPPFADASPALVRAALIPEDVERFDRQWRQVMANATKHLDLTEVLATLDSWRRIAWLTTANGPDSYRRMLSQADHVLRTGESPADSVPWRQLKAELGL